MVAPLTAFTSAQAAVASMLEVIDRVPLIHGLSQSGYRGDSDCFISHDKSTAAATISSAGQTGGTIELKNVSFAYPSRPDMQVCRDYSLVIEPGQMVALVGASGSGKSTIVQLLLRFYDPQEGAVLLNGKDLRSLNVRWLRSQIGYVGQEPVLFAGTIAENIAYGLDPDIQLDISSADNNDCTFTHHADPGIDQKRSDLMAAVVAAAKMANAHDFISAFPAGYNTLVGSGGSSISGGKI